MTCSAEPVRWVRLVDGRVGQAESECAGLGRDGTIGWRESGLAAGYDGPRQVGYVTRSDAGQIRMGPRQNGPAGLVGHPVVFEA